MTREDIKQDATVIDRWFPQWGTGIVTKILKSRVHIAFGQNRIIYDNAHLQFLNHVPHTAR